MSFSSFINAIKCTFYIVVAYSVYGDSCQFVIYRILCIKFTNEDDSYLYYVIENVFQLLQFHINMVFVGTPYAQLLLLHHMTRGTFPYSVRSMFWAFWSYEYIWLWQMWIVKSKASCNNGCLVKGMRHFNCKDTFKTIAQLKESLIIIIINKQMFSL